MQVQLRPYQSRSCNDRMTTKGWRGVDESFLVNAPWIQRSPRALLATNVGHRSPHRRSSLAARQRRKEGKIGPYKEEIESFLESIQPAEATEEAKLAAKNRKAAGKAESEPHAKAEGNSKALGNGPAVKNKIFGEDYEEEEDQDDDAEGSNGLPIKLSSNRWADVSEYMGSTFISIREYYEEDGEMLPTKRGISLSTEQFFLLKESTASIQTALEAEDTDFDLALSRKRAVRIFIFKGTARVDIREWYKENGKNRPGRKGISLNSKQWTALKKGMDKLHAAI